MKMINCVTPNINCRFGVTVSLERCRVAFTESTFQFSRSVSSFAIKATTNTNFVLNYTYNIKLVRAEDIPVLQ